MSRETLGKWMVEGELRLTRAQRRRFHMPRLRRDRRGELVQVDGSQHRWFENRGPPCTLLVFVDDATSAILQARFVPLETTFACFAALEGYLRDHGRPVALAIVLRPMADDGSHSDKHSVFRVARPNKHADGMTQFGRALAELNIEILCANSRPGQRAASSVRAAPCPGRLVKAQRLTGISDMEAANAMLLAFVADYNTRFAKTPARPDDRHRPLEVGPDRLREVLCLRDQRYVTQDHARITQITTSHQDPKPST